MKLLKTLRIKDYIRMTRGVLSLLGVRVEAGSWQSEARGLATSLLALAMTALAAAGFVRGGLDGAELSEAVMSYNNALFTLGAGLKLLLLQTTFRHSYDELFRFVDGWYLLGDPLSTTFALLYEGSVYGCVVICGWFVLLPLLTWQPVLPVEPFVPPWDRGQLTGYVAAYCLMVINTSFLLASMVCTDYVMYFACIGFRNRLVDIRRKFESISGERDFGKLLNTAKEHQEILRKLRVLEIPCGTLFFIQVFTSFIGACFMLFSAIKTDVESAGEVARMFACAAATYTHLLLYCWAGQNITNANDSLQFAIYNNKWYKCNPKMRESFHMIETFTCRTFEIQSSFVVKMSLKTFHKVITESYSFLMVLMRLTNKGATQGDPVIL